MINIHLLMGLPGSGKTYFANHYKSSQQVFVWSLDDGIVNKKYKLFDTMPYDLHYRQTIICNADIIIDGLLLTNKVVATAMKNIVDVLKNKAVQKFSFIIHHWDNDKTRCLHNDKFRRYGKDSKAVISNANYDRPDIDVIANISGFAKESITIVEHKVKNHSFKTRMCNEYGKKLQSKSWTVGGQWGDCWGNSGSVSSENPVEFTEFDELVSAIAPNITFMQYKKLYSACVLTEKDTDYGYYGSYTENQYYVCDIPTMCDWLIENNMVGKDE